MPDRIIELKIPNYLLIPMISQIVDDNYFGSCICKELAMKGISATEIINPIMKKKLVLVSGTVT